MAGAYYPEQALAVLRAARFDPTARPSLELISGCLIWGDEEYTDFLLICRSHGCTTHWEPVVFRSSLIRGQPDDRYRRAWEELLRACPEWPGFRPERRGESMRAELERQLAEEA